ncbi:hypothetical protein N7466_011516 [Penicillium verhagenii]|uniref:uncharacterized protein n=1 Tax=Penicillium verhagenii TaxID=1562060 RepID=UPI0025458CE2|nr:uncharacterized protein N7466_011516 [Penicillium verhagenii]KAJ5915583.1 hypothetical protein N7466_011516 [Penicillium verhagenii]
MTEAQAHQEIDNAMSHAMRTYILQIAVSRGALPARSRVGQSGGQHRRTRQHQRTQGSHASGEGHSQGQCVDAGASGQNGETVQGAIEGDVKQEPEPNPDAMEL